MFIWDVIVSDLAVSARLRWSEDAYELLLLFTEYSTISMNRRFRPVMIELVTLDKEPTRLCYS